MGTYYTIGVINEFCASSKENLLIDQWKEILNERIDFDLFNITINETKIHGGIKMKDFADNILDFFNVLRKICGPKYNEDFDAYEKLYGTDIDKYPIKYEELFVEDRNKNLIKIETNFAMMMIEGKVIIEEFYTDPHLINWLFRNSNIPNKLSGAVISSVTF